MQCNTYHLSAHKPRTLSRNALGPRQEASKFQNHLAVSTLMLRAGFPNSYTCRLQLSNRGAKSASIQIPAATLHSDLLFILRALSPKTKEKRTAIGAHAHTPHVRGHSRSTLAVRVTSRLICHVVLSIPNKEAQIVSK